MPLPYAEFLKHVFESILPICGIDSMFFFSSKFLLSRVDCL